MIGNRERRYTDNKSGDPIPLRPAVLRRLIGRRFPRMKIAKYPPLDAGEWGRYSA